MLHDTKVCPFCAEDIKAAAVVCKHCGRDLNGYQDTISKTQDSYAREYVERKEPLPLSIKRLFDFRGKANRTEFIVYTFGPTLCLLIPVLFLLDYDILESEICNIFFFVYGILNLTSIFSVAARRFNHLGRDALLVLLYFVPYVNIGTVLYLLFTSGRKKKKRW